MIVTPRIVLRIALVILAGVILQLSFFSQITILGASPNILPVLVVCLGLLGGAVVGAMCGFAIGFLIDSALLQTLGVSSLALLTAGYLAGRYREGFDVTSPLVPPLLAGALTLLATGGFAIVQLMLGFLLAFPLYPLVRRILRAALVEDTPRRGRLPIPFRTA